MMIEKDYLIKYRFNVVIARPKQLFTKVYSKVSSDGYRLLKSKYENCITDIKIYNDGSAIVMIDLQKLWSGHFCERSFPVLKHNYYKGALLPDCDVQPRLKLSYVFEDLDKTISKFKELFDVLTSFFVSQGYNFFEKDTLTSFLKTYYTDRTSRQIAAFVLSTYSGEQKTFGGGIEENAFLQEKHTMPRQYKVFCNRYEASFASTLSLLAKLMDGCTEKVSRFVSSENSISYVRIGHILEILDIGSFEMRGGEAPMIFVRLNSPEIVRRDAFSTEYSNILFDKTQEKHTVSTEIMNHFFTHKYTNEERWDFIEDFFLGENNEELIRRYPGSEVERMDVIEQLKKRKVQKVKNAGESSVGHSSITYPPREGTYKPKDHLTIEIDGKNITHSIAEWIEIDPLSLHELVKTKTIYVESGTVYKCLMSEIESKYPQYYAKLLALRKLIQIPGYSEPVMAEVVMRENPLKFYKWWSANRDEVFIPIRDKVWLFQLIENDYPGKLRVIDRNFLNGK